MNFQRTLNELFDGLQYVRRTSFLTAAAALALTGAASAQSVPQIGAKLGINGNGGAQNSDPGALLPTDLAGAPGYAQTNWNSLGRYGASAAVFDSSGAATTVTFSWDSNNLWSEVGGGTPAIEAAPDDKLMNGYCDSNASVTNFLDYTQPVDGYAGTNNNCKPWVYVQGLNAWMTANHISQYDVVVYSDGDNNGGRGGEFWIQNATGPWTGPGMTLGSDITTHSFLTVDSVFVGGDETYHVSPPTVLSGREAQSGNWQGNVLAAFNSLTNDSFLLRKNTYNFRCPINAVQIVPRAAPLPATIDPLLAAHVYSGGTAAFRARVAGIVPMTFQWLKNGTPLSDGGNISGSATAKLSVSPVSGVDAANYSVVVSNVMGAVTSSVAPLTITSPTPGSYAEKIFTNQPVAYWRLTDTGDPSTNYSVATDFVGGFNGTYESAAQNGFNAIAGPQPPAFPGFESGNGALQSAANTPHTWVIAPPLNLSNNTVTITAWIYPTAYNEPGSAGLVWSRNGGDVNGLDYQNNNNLGYTWNNQSGTYNFASGLIVPSNMWSFAAVTITPSNATLYLFNANGIGTAVNNVTNDIAGWSGPTTIGVDPASAGNPSGRAFTGSIAQAAVFNYDVAPLELYNMYKKAVGLTVIPATITSQPQSLDLYTGRPAVFHVAASGDTPLTYQWQTNGVNLVNGGRISGATSPTLTIANTQPGDAGSYDVVVNNVAAQPVTSAPATLTLVASNAAPVAYEAAVEAGNPIGYWRFNEPAASLYAYDYWGGNIATNENVTTAVAGPQPPDFPGFETTNSSYSFDGLSAATDTQESILNNLHAFTIIGWFNETGAEPANAGLFGQPGSISVGFLPDLTVTTAGGGAVSIPAAGIVAGQWYMVAAIGDGHNLSLYLVTTGSVQQVSTSVTTTSYGSSPYPFRIGGGGVFNTTGDFFAGQIDEVAVFNTALSASQLSAIVGAALNGGPLAPSFVSQPQSEELYAGRNALLSASALATAPVTYQWQMDGTNLTDGGNVAGSSTENLSITAVTPANAGTYDLIVSNPVGVATSSVVSLTIVTPVPASYESKVIAYKPLAYWRLNETNGTTAWDFYGGHNGTYQAGATMDVPGPENPPFSGFEGNNSGVGISGVTAASYVSVPFGSLGTNNATMVAWIYPVGVQNAWSGILMTRGSGIEGGFGYNGSQMLVYTWNNNNGNTWGWVSNLLPPTNTWSMAALVVYPDKAIVYMGTTNSLVSATNAIPHTPDVFGNNWRIGNDGIGDPGRTFNGTIDEVAVFNYSLSPAQIAQLFGAANVGSAVRLSIAEVAGKIQLTWPQGTLYQSSVAGGPYTAVAGNPSSPYLFTPTGTATFFRVKVQ